MTLSAMAEPEIEYGSLFDELPHRLTSEYGFNPIPEYPGDFVEVGGRRLHVRSTPDLSPEKRTAIYVHGLGGSSTNWTDLMYLLEPVTNGHSIDLPGFGRSPLPQDRDYSIQSHAEAVIAFIEEQCSGPVDLFGNSMGGAIAMRIAGSRPELVRSLVLISPAVPSLKIRREMFQVMHSALPSRRTLIELFKGNRDPVEAVEQMYDVVYMDKSCVHPTRREQEIEVAQWRLDHIRANEPFWMSYRGLLRTYLPGLAGNTWNYGFDVEAPTLAIFGTHDMLVDPRMAVPMAKAIEHSVVVTMHTGHVAQLEHPVQVAGHVLNLWSN